MQVVNTKRWADETRVRGSGIWGGVGRLWFFKHLFCFRFTIHQHPRYVCSAHRIVCSTTRDRTCINIIIIIGRHECVYPPVGVGQTALGFALTIKGFVRIFSPILFHEIRTLCVWPRFTSKVQIRKQNPIKTFRYPARHSESSVPPHEPVSMRLSNIRDDSHGSRTRLIGFST